MEHNQKGATYSQLGVCTVMNFEGVDDETKTLVHEFGHFYYAPDHYDIGDVPGAEEIKDIKNNDGFNRRCIYGEDKDVPDVAENLIICDGCKDEILSNRNRFNH